MEMGTFRQSKHYLSLNSKNCIVYSKKDKNQAIAILEDSEHFEKTLIVTLFAGSEK